MSYGKRTCLQCGQEFEAAYIAQLCCTQECQKRRRQNRKNAWDKHYRASRREVLEKLQDLLASAQKEAAESAEALTAVTLMYRAEQRRLQDAVKRLALRRLYLEGRCKELVAQVMKQGEEINCLRGRMEKYAKIDAFMQQDAAAKEDAPKAKKAADKKTLDETLKRAKAKVREELVMHECKRMKVRGTSLPCGKRVECFEVTRCEHVPDGMRLEL